MSKRAAQAARTQRGRMVLELMKGFPGAQGDEAEIERGLRTVRELQRQGVVSQNLDVAIQQLRSVTPQAATYFRQDTAERELSAFGARLGQSDLATINQLHTAGGWPALRTALAGYLSPDALEVLEGTYRQTGGNLNAVGELVSQRIQREAAQSEAARLEAQSLEKWDPEKAADPSSRRLLERSTLAAAIRDPGFRAQAKRWFTEHAAQLKAAGYELKPGQDPAEALFNLAREVGTDAEDFGERARSRPGQQPLPTEKALAEVSRLLGEKDSASLRAFLRSANQVTDEHDFMNKVSRSFADEDKARRARVSMAGRQIQETPTRRDGVRSAMEKAGDSLKVDDEAARPSHTPARSASTPQAAPSTKGDPIRSAMERAEADLTSNESESSDDPTDD